MRTPSSRGTDGTASLRTYRKLFQGSEGAFQPIFRPGHLRSRPGLDKPGAGRRPRPYDRTSQLALGPRGPLVAFALLAIIGERQTVRLTDNLQLSVAFLPLLFVAVVFGPAARRTNRGGNRPPDFGRPFTRWVIWTANRTLIGGLAGIAAQQAMANGTNTFGRIIAATSVAAIVDFGLDFILNGMTLVLRGTGSIRGLARTTWPVAGRRRSSLHLHCRRLAYTYIAFTPWSAALFFIPALAAQRLFVIIESSARR